MLAATQLKVGMLVLYNGKPHRVATVMHRTPGNLRGFVQAKMRNLKSGTMTENRFSSEDRVEKAMLDVDFVLLIAREGEIESRQETIPAVARQLVLE